MKPNEKPIAEPDQSLVRTGGPDKRSARSLATDETGIAAVEFAMILPLMLVIYLGLVEMSRGLRAAQKLDLVTHTLADLTAQQLAGGIAAGQAGLTGADFQSVFSAATTLLAPLPTANLKMTISEIEISQVPPLPSPAVTWVAKTRWTVALNSGAQRPIGPLGASDTAKPVSSGTMPSSYTTVVNGVNPVTGPVIVADVVYSWSPGVNFEMFNWKSPPTWTMSRTNYAPVRNTFVPNHIQYQVGSPPAGMTGTCYTTNGSCP